jgi:putative pre-16S rRNA nuclease
MNAREILGIDVGQKRTGIARASNIARLAEPLMSVSTTDAVSTLAKYLKEHEVEAIAVGLPRNLRSEDTDQTAWVRQWVDKAKQSVSTPLYWQDEALTSVAAESLNLKAKSPAGEHALAAAIVLQDFLDTPDAERVAC